MKTRELLWKSLKCLSSCHGRRHVIRTLVIIFVFLPTCDIGKSHEEGSQTVALQMPFPVQVLRHDVSGVPLRKQFKLHKVLHGADSHNTACLKKEILGVTMAKEISFSTKRTDIVSSHIDTPKLGNRKQFLEENMIQEILESTAFEDLPLHHSTPSPQYHGTQTPTPSSNVIKYSGRHANDSRKQSLRNIHGDTESDSGQTINKMFAANMTKDPISSSIFGTMPGTTGNISTNKMSFLAELMGTTEMLTTLDAMESPVLKEVPESHEIKYLPRSLMETEAVEQFSTSGSLSYSKTTEQLVQMKTAKTPSFWDTTKPLITQGSQTPSLIEGFPQQPYLSRTITTRSCCGFSYETCRREAHLYLTQDFSSVKDECPENVTSQSRSVICTRTSEAGGAHGRILPAPRCLCAHVQHCILDVSHRAHNCINGDLCKCGFIIKAQKKKKSMLFISYICFASNPVSSNFGYVCVL